jgi:DNA primase
VIAKRVRLIKKGREYLALCPFHSEKTPSFTVNDDKGFYHCFGCGAHGDVIGFTMRSESLPFPEAVEKLAGMAGLAVPRLSPAERAREAQRETVQDVVEAAGAWFEAQLRAPVGRAGLDYLHRRGLDDTTIARFRLGFAPDARTALKTALIKDGITEARLIEAGLLVKPEPSAGSGGGDSDVGRSKSTEPRSGGRDETFDFFRGRVIFPIFDRRGRAIAFGGRILGDGQPKYLNSRDTPLFDKGRTLYALDKAREGVRQGAQLVVVEGYMDVIALHAAGFTGAVAPLGTALTESQIELLWKLAPEPILCFDGDTAGQRAALRAAERVLALLKPGYSLRFASLPAGEDPDSLIRRQGPSAFAEVLGHARPLAEVLWETLISSVPTETPEQRALLELRLEETAAKVENRTVQWQYRRLFRLRVRTAFFPGFRGRRPRPEGQLRAPGHVLALHAVPEKVVLATLLNHLDMLASREIYEELDRFAFEQPRFHQLKNDLFRLGALEADLPIGTLHERLRANGHGSTLDELLSRDVYLHAPFARPVATLEDAGYGWHAYVRGLFLRRLGEELGEARDRFTHDPSPENLRRVEELGHLVVVESDEAAQRDLFEVPQESTSGPAQAVNG